MTPVLPRQLVETMASREHRLHHWIWHEVRNKWLTYPEDLQKQIEEMGWKPPRPAQDERGRPIVDNDAGEDFFYMHRQMLVHASRILSEVNDPNYPRVLVWKELPAPGDPDFPVPPVWYDPTRGLDAIDRRTGYETLQRLKSDIFYQKRLLTWQRMFTDPAFLTTVTLGELGTRIEQSIHSGMHLRWATPPAGSRPEPDASEGNTIKEIWDDPRYDFLGDTYSSHVNPVFWSLHGWIDDRVEDWKAANSVFGNNFWKGTWVGVMPGTHQEMHAAPPPGPPQTPPPAASGAFPPQAEQHQGMPAAVDGAVDGHHGAKREDFETLVTAISKCGIFYDGYARILSSTMV